MKPILRILAVFASLLALANEAIAGSIYVFNYSDPSGNVANGTLSLVPSGLGDGSLWATAGTLNVTSSSDGNASVGTYALLAAGTPPTFSPSGLFIVDDLIYPNNNAASGLQNAGLSGNPSFLTNYGLLFGQPGTGSQGEVNIWGNGNGDYAFFTEVGGNYNIQQGSGGSFTVAPAVPEPSTFAIFGVMLALGAGCYFMQRRRVVAAASVA